MATQPGHGWHEGTVASWSRNIGILGLVHSVGLWHGVLAFGFGLVLGLTLDTVPVPVAAPAATAVAATPRRDETMVDDRRGPRWRQRPAVERDADEPLTAEREEARTAEPNTVTVGPRVRHDDVRNED
jgi:hypothetical protein